MNRFALILILFMGLIQPALADAVPTPEHTGCSIEGFVKERADVYDSPDSPQKIIGFLPAAFTGAGEYPVSSMAEVEITDSKNGWIKIKNAMDNSALMEANETPMRKMFIGTGWVRGEKITVKSQSDTGYAKPDASSEPLAQDSLMFDITDAQHLVDCKGTWAFIEVDTSIKIGTEEDRQTSIMDDLNLKPEAFVDQEKKNFRVWVNKICGLQETSCSGTGE